VSADLDQRLTFRCVQAEGIGQAPQRIEACRARQAAFQVGDAARAQAGAFGQRLL
jgi:hypothetical protein